MKIFFTGSPRALRLDNYNKYLNSIYNVLSNYGEHTSTLVIKNNPDEFYNYSLERINKHYKDTIDDLRKADVIVAEVSMHSMAMGYLINKALELSKPTLCLYTKGKKPFFLSGIKDPNLVNLEYSGNSINDVIDDAFDYFSGRQDKRFNLMLSPKMVNFLNDLSKKRKIPKSQIIRNTIFDLMKKESN